MITFHPALRLAALAVTLVAAGCSSTPMMPMGGSTLHFGATLNGASEVPPTSSTGSGTLDATLDKSSNTLSWTLTYSGLTGAATAAHFHGPAAPGANAGVAVPFATVESPAKGQALLTPAQVEDLKAGTWYVNVHTAANKGGEIRGQVTAK
jgi:hypothetical protein